MVAFPLLKPVVSLQQALLRHSIACTARTTPLFLQKRIIEPLLARSFYHQLADGELDFLKGKSLRIDIEDYRTVLAFSLVEDRLQLIPAPCDATVTIRTTSIALLEMINQEQDPDTLFFQRRLLIEGDTETGLHVKNSLDALDPDDMPQLLLAMLRAFSGYQHWAEKKLRAV